MKQTEDVFHLQKNEVVFHLHKNLRSSSIYKKNVGRLPFKIKIRSSSIHKKGEVVFLSWAYLAQARLRQAKLALARLSQATNYFPGGRASATYTGASATYTGASATYTGASATYWGWVGGELNNKAKLSQVLLNLSLG